jgi:hypothetical protein
LLWQHPITTGDLRHDSAWSKRLLDYPGLVIRRPTTPAANSFDQLDPAHKALRLKRKVKPRHKPVLETRLRDRQLHISRHILKNVLTTSLTVKAIAVVFQFMDPVVSERRFPRSRESCGAMNLGSASDARRGVIFSA